MAEEAQNERQVKTSSETTGTGGSVFRQWKVITDEDISFFEGAKEWEKYREELRWVDENEDCRVLHFIEVTTQTEWTKEEKEQLNQIRGWVFSKETGKCLLRGFAYPLEWSDIAEDLELDHEPLLETDWKFYYSVEGTLLRIFHSGKQWNVSTNKKLDAFQSKWSSTVSFGDMFDRALHTISPEPKSHVLFEFLKTLDKDTVYYFVIRSHEENRIVCKAPVVLQEQIVYIGKSPLYDTQLSHFEDSFGNGGDMDEQSSDTEQWLRRFQPIRRLNWKSDERGELTWKHLHEFVNETISSDEYQGIFGFNKKTGRQLKIYSDVYRKGFELRGKHPNIRYRYLELRTSPHLQDFIAMYPYYQKAFHSVETSLERLAKTIHRYYVHRFVHNHYINLPKEEFSVMKKCHELYLQDRERNRVYLHIVKQVLESEPILNQYRMLRRLYKKEKYMDQPSTRYHNQQPSFFRHRPPHRDQRTFETGTSTTSSRQQSSIPSWASIVSRCIEEVVSNVPSLQRETADV